VRPQERQEAAILLITHNLAVVAETCDRVIVMYGGKIQEVASVKELFRNPLHPYTEGLLACLPTVEGERATRLRTISGNVPSAQEFPPGCKFTSRCAKRMEICEHIEPALLEIAPGHWVRCHLFDGQEFPVQ
jgi:oligopeptide/dipeptide ABC transporter ATP-binding protein